MLKEKIRTLANQLHSEIVDIRRHLHQHPLAIAGQAIAQGVVVGVPTDCRICPDREQRQRLDEIGMQATVEQPHRTTQTMTDEVNRLGVRSQVVVEQGECRWQAAGFICRLVIAPVLQIHLAVEQPT